MDPFNNKYRMIDGMHRIQKLLLNGNTHGLCYVFDINELRPYDTKRVFTYEKLMLIDKDEYDKNIWIDLDLLTSAPGVV